MKTVFFICIAFQVMGQINVSTISGEFNGSGGLQMGLDGYLYIANFGAGLDQADGTEVWRMDIKNNGQPELFATGLNGASGNDFDSEGNLYQSNISAGTVSKISPSADVSLFATTNISCNVGINIDDENNLYVCNCCGNHGNTITKVTPSGSTSIFAHSSLLFCPNGITRDSEDNMYVSNFSNGRILKITPSGSVSLLATTPGIPGVSAPSNGHIIYSPQENVLYVASHGSHKIYRLTLDGQLEVLAGSGSRGNEDGPADEATFSRPNGLALSATGDTLFVNSSIPTTDQGIRPLNPSVVRMITGLRNIVKTEKVNEFLKEIFFDSSSRVLTIKMKHGREYTISIYDRSGQLVFQRLRTKEENTRIKLDKGLSNGIYYVRIADNRGNQFSKAISLML